MWWCCSSCDDEFLIGYTWGGKVKFVSWWSEASVLKYFFVGVVGKRVGKYLSSCYMKNSFREIFIKSFATIEGHEIPLPLCFSQGSTLYIRGKFAIPLKIVSFVWNFSFIRLFPVVFIKYQNLFFFFFPSFSSLVYTAAGISWTWLHCLLYCKIAKNW